jgi:hypothetical protein
MCRRYQSQVIVCLEQGNSEKRTGCLRSQGQFKEADQSSLRRMKDDDSLGSVEFDCRLSRRGCKLRTAGVFIQPSDAQCNSFLVDTLIPTFYSLLV